MCDGQLEPDASVAGYDARGREVLGVCHLRDCRRRCHIDFALLAERGLGRLHVEQVKRLFRCHRLDGCALDFQEKGGGELVLSALTRKVHVALRVTCGGCGKATVSPAEAVIARLKAEGLGGGGLPVSSLAGLIRGNCGTCGEKRWRVDVLWQDPARLPAWYRKALGL